MCVKVLSKSTLLVVVILLSKIYIKNIIIKTNSMTIALTEKC